MRRGKSVRIGEKGSIGPHFSVRRFNFRNRQCRGKQCVSSVFPAVWENPPQPIIENMGKWCEQGREGAGSSFGRRNGCRGNVCGFSGDGIEFSQTKSRMRDDADRIGAGREFFPGVVPLVPSHSVFSLGKAFFFHELPHGVFFRIQNFDGDDGIGGKVERKDGKARGGLPLFQEPCRIECVQIGDRARRKMSEAGFVGKVGSSQNDGAVWAHPVD